MGTSKTIQMRQQTYVRGNTVPKEAPERRLPEKQNNKAYTIRRNQEKALQMDLPYLVALVIAACCALYLCVNYLQVQASITSRIHTIQSMEQELEALKSENDALTTRINTYVDLDHIYQVATQELGMVYANKDQVLLYNKTESEYVRQYEDIPKR